MKLTVQFDQNEKNTITAFAELVEKTCWTIDSRCSLCPLHNRICKGNENILIEDLVEASMGYDSDIDSNVNTDEEPMEEEVEDEGE